MDLLYTCRGLAVCLLWTCCVSPRSRFHFLRERISCYFRSTAKNIFEKRCRKFLSIGSLAGKYWNKTNFSCKKCADAPIIRRKKWQTHKVDRTNNSFIQLRVFFSRIHKKSAYRHYVGTPIYDNLEAEYIASLIAIVCFTASESPSNYFQLTNTLYHKFVFKSFVLGDYLQAVHN